MPKGRLEYLKRLLPYLQNQSEDCLYLNIYVPIQERLKANRVYPSFRSNRDEGLRLPDFERSEEVTFASCIKKRYYLKINVHLHSVGFLYMKLVDCIRNLAFGFDEMWALR
uniref:Uncharacterized protein n=1 Tax=Glossina palpalis gambiensis TaxID=67801 RepID=A0A1B0AZI2_9MUSC